MEYGEGEEEDDDLLASQAFGNQAILSSNSIVQQPFSDPDGPD